MNYYVDFEITETLMILEQLETFIAIADQGGLRAASSILFKTQPTLSLSIKNLETELGVKLLDRTGYRVSLSQEGEKLYPEAKI